MRAGPLVLVKKAVGNEASDIVGSFSEATMRRGARDRRGLRGEEHRRGQEHRAKRCGYAQILSSGTSIAKEHVGTSVGEPRRQEAGRRHEQGREKLIPS